jgi:crossover junction endodeoxyribonuclease RusA
MWVLDIPPGDLINANERLHWAVRARRTRDLKRDALVVARAARVPRMDRIRVVGVVHPPDRRRRDPHNLYPTLKAYIDGIVKAGVIVDDDSEHLVGVEMVMGAPSRPMRLSVMIYRVDSANHRV